MYSYQNKKELLTTIAVFVSAILLIVRVVLNNYFLPLPILYIFVPRTPVSWEDPSLTAYGMNHTVYLGHWFPLDFIYLFIFSSLILITGYGSID